MQRFPVLRAIVFSLATALIVVVGSERMYWYYADVDLESTAVLTAFYAVAVSVLLWLVDRFQTTGFWSFLLAVPAFGWIVEGVVTPILYSGGPVPFFPLWFTGWHGLLAVVVLWWGVRLLLVEDRRAALAGLSVVVGAFWGTWATTMWLPENLDDPELAESLPAVRSPGDFARFAALASLTLVVGHVVADRTWIVRLPRSRPIGLAVIGYCGLMVIAWTLVYWWAAPMMAVLLGWLCFGLRRRRPVVAKPTLARLAGSVSPAAYLGLAPLPVTAAAVYAGWFAVDLGVGTIRVIHYGTIAVQTVAAAVLLTMAWRRSGANAKASVPDAAPTVEADDGSLPSSRVR
ncbi:MAG: hypothetical protein AAF547_05935 [Actinomycetota bacterium]